MREEDTTDFQELAAVMEELPGGDNYGRQASTNPQEEGRYLPLEAREMQTREFMQSGGWGIVDTSRGSHAGGYREAGMTTHRGTLSPTEREYIDYERLVALVEQRLGFTFDDVHDVYRQGPLSAAQRELRDRIDARLLQLAEKGANMIELGRVIGFAISPAGAAGGASCRTMERALARAREAA